MTRASLEDADRAVGLIVEEYFKGLFSLDFSKETIDGAWAMYRLALDHTLAQLGWTFEEYDAVCVSDEENMFQDANSAA